MHKDCSHYAARDACCRIYPALISHVFLSLPLDGFGSAVSSFQARPVFGAVSSRVPPSNTVSCFVSFGDKSWDNFKNFFQTQVFKFLFFCPKGARRVVFGGSIALKTSVLKLNRSLAREPPASTASELMRAACGPFAKPQVLGLHHWQEK